MFESVDVWTHGRTHGRTRLESHTISSPSAFRSGELKSSENDQLTGHFLSCFFKELFFLISPEQTVKLVKYTNSLY